MASFYFHLYRTLDITGLFPKIGRDRVNFSKVAEVRFSKEIQARISVMHKKKEDNSFSGTLKSIYYKNNFK